MSDIILRNFDCNLISQRQCDGYLDATAMCKASGKRWPDYIRLESTKVYYEALSSVVQICTTDLIQTKQGGTDQGTWIHPKAAIHLAQWLSPEFAVQVSEWVFELLTHGYVDIRGQAVHTRSGKLLLWDGFASEDCLAEMIHSFVAGICGHQHLEKEVPYVDLTNNKNRRLDFVERYSKIVRGYELKLKQFTASDLVTTLGEKSYYHVLKETIDKLDRRLNRKYIRPIKFVLMSPVGITSEAKQLLELMPQIEFKSVQEYCLVWLKKAWVGKYKYQHKELANKVLIKYQQLFSPEVLNILKNYA